ncbi:MAG: threonine ammonia-lyase, biosynthetic [Gammaproteobacteria bacterium]
MISDYLYRILKARVYDVAIETPLEPAPRLSKRFGNMVLFKREDLQPVFSFKLRGAYNKLIQIPQDDLARGVICASAGNHAQGVALAAKELGVRSVVVMPESTPTIKIKAVETLGGKVILDGATYDDAYARAVELAKNDDLVFIHPFDDPEVIAGQGTIGMEIHRQQKGKVDAVFVPVGGGGLIAGIAMYIKALSPETKIIGVEPQDSASMTAALEAGKPVTLSEVGSFADGVAVRRVGDETFRICKEHVDEIVLVDNDEICAAIQDIFEDTRAIVEPAGALAVAGMKRYVDTTGVKDQTLVTVNCGANINFDRLRHIAERAALGEQREALLAVEIPEQPGSFVAFCEAIGQRNLTEFNYRYHDKKTARIFVGIELARGRDEKNEIVERLKKQGYPVIDITDNEMAKLHIRHMVGGYAGAIDDERLYRFEFPERRGALLAFLKAIGHRWNISLFHYRNHGSDYGRVLAGVQVPESERDEFDEHLRDLGYPFEEESDNPAYKMFLAE